MLALGYIVTWLDLRAPATEAKADRLGRTHRFETRWGDLTDPEAVQHIVAATRPDILVHAAAIIPPLSIQRPEFAHAVNIGGTAALIRACEMIGTVRRFVLVSSYSVCRPANPYRDPARWSGTTPVNPQDDFGRQKVEAERLVHASDLGWSIIRLCTVFPLSSASPDADTLRFSFTLPFDRREHAIDVRDAALAIAKAAHVEAAEGRLFIGGGGEGWFGLTPFPRALFGRADPAQDASWFHENWVDTTESQQLLDYQRHSFADHLRERRKRMGLIRYVLPLISGFIGKALARKSPFYGRAQMPDPRSFGEAAREVLGVSY